jgi:Holliday junction resolvase RusA-like endonuclease
MKPKLEFIIPGQVIPCGRPRATIINGHVHTYMPRETIEYERRVALIARAIAQNCESWKSVYAEKLPIRVHMHFVRRAWRFDWDNAAKSVCDGLAASERVFSNDNRITQALVSLHTDPRAEPRTEVLIEPASIVLDEPLWMRVAREHGWAPTTDKRETEYEATRRQ